MLLLSKASRLASSVFHLDEHPICKAAQLGPARKSWYPCSNLSASSAASASSNAAAARKRKADAMTTSQPGVGEVISGSLTAACDLAGLEYGLLAAGGVLEA
jgi:hypothetical protein